jgi:hypothetical protein
MRPNDWFKLACRVLGMWQLVDTAGYTLSIFNMAAGFATVPAGYSLPSYLVQTIGSFLVAVVLLLGAPIIADIFYPDSPGDEDAKKKPPDSNTPTI